MKKLLSYAVAVVVLVAIIACGGGGDPAKPDKFTRDCKVRGGHVQKTQHGRICAPPVGGWQ